MLELRDGATGQRAVETLRQVATEVGNLPGRSSTASATRFLEYYLSWTEDAERTLGNIFERDVVEDLIYTQHYWTLRTATSETARLVAQVLAEADSRHRALTSVLDDFVGETERWQSSSATIVVPDTNMFLQEGAPFDEIDWDTIHHPGYVRIVIPILVIHELDRLKRQGNNTTRKLARESLRWLTGPSSPPARCSLG